MLTTPRLIVIALCAALNFSIGTVVYLIKLPIYLDQIGTILCVLLLAFDRRAAFLCACLAGAIAVLITGVLFNPFLPWFMLTMVGIALVSTALTAGGVETFRARPVRRGEFSDASSSMAS
jgi:energy-coupling factor transport system substrate-specific component